MNASNKEIDCPFCKKSKIDVTITPSYYSYTTARAVHQVKRIPVFHPERIEVHSKCLYCKKSKKDIKEATQKGTTKESSHEEFLKRLKDAGLPSRITSEVKKD